MQNLDKQAAQIRSRKDFIAFTMTLLIDLKEHPEQWENDDLPSFLEALSAWVADMDGYYINRGESVPEVPTWGMLGQIFLAARKYE
jgi:hypothetical protein